MTIWKLPRPSSFVDNIEFDIREGSSVIARFPSSVPSGLENELRERLHSLWEWTTIDASVAGPDPVAFLRHRICPEVSARRVRSMADLAHTPSFQGSVLCIENIDRSDWAQWASALVAYADASRNVDLVSRTLLIVVLSGDVVAEKCPNEVALVRRDFRDVVDVLELFMFALWRAPISIETPEQRALLAHTISQVARWDCLLAEQLLSLPLDEALSPEDALLSYAQHSGWTSSTSRCWENGTIDGPADRPVVHSALLSVSGESRSIRQRIWTAQAAVLLPLVEERRVRIISHCRRYLRLPLQTERGQLIRDPLDLEVGLLAWCLERTNTPQAVKRQVRWLRDARNKLAHMEPLEPAEALHATLLSD